MDIYSSERKLPHIGRVAVLPEASPAAGDNLMHGLPPFLIINWMVPNYPPSSMLGPKRTDGPGWNLVLYCRLAEHLRVPPPPQPLSPQQPGAERPQPAPPPGNASGPALARLVTPAPEAASSAPPSAAAVDLVRRFMHPTGGVKLRGERLKCIMGLAEMERPAFNLLLKTAILRNNFKPFLSKTASFCYRRASYFEIDIDMHTWSLGPLTAFSKLKGSLPQMLLRGGVLIEADGDHEMPENILAALYLTHLNPAEAPAIDPAAAAYLHDPSNHVPPLERQGRRGAKSPSVSARASGAAAAAAAAAGTDSEEATLGCDSMQDSMAAIHSDAGGDSPVSTELTDESLVSSPVSTERGAGAADDLNAVTDPLVASMAALDVADAGAGDLPNRDTPPTK